MKSRFIVYTALVLSVIVTGAFISAAHACGSNCQEPTPTSISIDNALGDITQRQGQTQKMQQGQTANGGSVGPISNTVAGGAGGQGGTSSANGGTSTLTDASSYIDQSRSMTAVQPSRLPDTITLGNLTLQAKGECGRRHDITPFTRVRHTPKLLGLWSTQEDVQTAHGLDAGPAEQPLLTETVEIPATNERITTVYGHRLYVTGGTDGSNGASSMAANHDNGNFYGLGTGNSAGMNYGVVGFVALECEFRVHVGKIVEDQIKFDPPAAGPAKAAKTPIKGTGPCKMPGRVRHADGYCYLDPCELCLKSLGVK